jgi:D-alanyl-D-alanine endopeptidase (penicillin-binding protein 7)
MLAIGGMLFALLTQPSFATTAASPAAARHDPQIRSSAVLIVDEADSSVLLARNADVAVPIASITKLMTSLVVLEAGLPLDEPLKMTREDTTIANGGPSR